MQRRDLIRGLVGLPFMLFSSASSANRNDERGACSAGFNTTLLPTASAGATFHTARSRGKFQGVTAPTTPIGSRVAMPSASGAVGTTSP